MLLAGSPARSRRALDAPLIVAGAALAATTYVRLVDPNQTGHYPACPFRAFTGYACPGCGSLRAVHDLTTGDVAGALHHNPLTVLAIPLFAALWVLWLRFRVTGRPLAAGPAWLRPALLWSLLGLVLAFWLGRNLVGWLGP